MIGEQNAVVIGGGIAGLASAIALGKAGIDAQVFESRGAAQSDGGLFLTVGVNGLHALRTLGIEPRELGGFDTPKMALFLGDGTRLCEFGTAPPRTDGLVAQTVLRADLHRALHRAATAQGAAVHFGKTLERCASTAHDVQAHFTDGTQARGRWLVGADGISSRVRRIVDPQAPAARYLGLLNTGGIASGVDVPGDAGTMHMFFGRRCFFAYVPRGDGQAWWFANPASARVPARDEPLDADASGRKRYLLSLFEGDRHPARELIDATPQPAPMWPTYDLPHVPRWHRDAMVLVGDAAHAASPSSGQGASMAIEDAVELGRCLRDNAGPGDAFAAFERLRRARVEKVVALGRRNGSGKTPGPLGRVVRDAFLRWWFSRPSAQTLQEQRWLYDHRIDWAQRASAAPWPS
jgi:2-polyprenyl-6-methoxyphenol hydroxylase-like FAD-dependent oxidoreductase